jgi:hypothetical protein
MEILIYVSLVVLLVLGFIFLIPRSNHKGKGDAVRSGGNGKVKFIFHQRYCCFQKWLITLTNRAISFTMLFRLLYESKEANIVLIICILSF